MVYTALACSKTSARLIANTITGYYNNKIINTTLMNIVTPHGRLFLENSLLICRRADVQLNVNTYSFLSFSSDEIRSVVYECSDEFFSVFYISSYFSFDFRICIQ